MRMAQALVPICDVEHCEVDGYRIEDQAFWLLCLKNRGPVGKPQIYGLGLVKKGGFVNRFLEAAGIRYPENL